MPKFEQIYAKKYTVTRNNKTRNKKLNIIKIKRLDHPLYSIDTPMK